MRAALEASVAGQPLSVRFEAEGGCPPSRVCRTRGPITAPELPQPHPAEHLLKPVRQLIKSMNDTLKGQLDLELHGGRTIDGVTARIAPRVLALTAAIWHNRATGQPLTRSLIAYDH
ncbi:hypothetical protein GCM10011609_84740 [Lentzea pudingi]|uniref:Transposase n=1 Tax=Lentzea pudingi TaxID=1789439 RepID=A0ABQ2IVH8_9PSEU|nr:hypothetical protein GCM10011609_84740 [Lentzea pudingi]